MVESANASCSSVMNFGLIAAAVEWLYGSRFSV